MTDHEHRYEDHSHSAPPADPGTSWTGYALVKYGIILIITIVVLYFLARYLLPLFTD